MKRLSVLTITLSIALPLLFTAPVKANYGMLLCQAVAADNNPRLRKVLKSNRIKIRSVFKDLRCNGNNLLVFANKFNANKTAKVIIGKLTRDMVSNTLSDLNGDILVMAKKRVEG